MNEEDDPLRFEKFDEPYPRQPFALFPEGGYAGPEGFDFLIHKEISNESQCVFLFESIVDAFAVAEEYKGVTGKDAEARPLDVRGIEERFWVKFYRSSGDILMLPLIEYLKRT